MKENISKLILIIGIVLLVCSILYLGGELLWDKPITQHDVPGNDNLELKNYMIDANGRKVVVNPEIVEKEIDLGVLTINEFSMAFDNEQSHISGRVFNNSDNEIPAGALFMLSIYGDDDVLLAQSVVQTMRIYPNEFQMFDVYTSADCSECRRIEIEEFENEIE